MRQLRIPATYMRGGTSKGVFFVADDLPMNAAERDRWLLRIVGSPDAYGKQIDGMGGATSSTSKVVLVSRSSRPDCDVDYLFGAVAIGNPVIDWTGNCGNLSAAVGPFALERGLVANPPKDGLATVRIWQANIGQKILAQVPMAGGQVEENGSFMLDGVSFPAPQVALEFLEPEPAAGQAAPCLFPTGNRVDELRVGNLPPVPATLIVAGIPTVFIHAASLGLKGTELPDVVNGQPDVLLRAEALRGAGAVAMGLAANPYEATRLRPHTPKLALVAPPASYVASDGRPVDGHELDLVCRIFSMGPMHHAMTGTGGLAIAAAAAIPGTLVHQVRRSRPGGCDVERVCFGHAAGRLEVGIHLEDGPEGLRVVSTRMNRSARVLMEGWVRLPAEGLV
jgi:probable AcnD-accessory protein PrpF